VGMARAAGSGDCGVCDLGHLEVCGVRPPNLAAVLATDEAPGRASYDTRRVAPKVVA
jgi:hypothetical protein